MFALFLLISVFNVFIGGHYSAVTLSPSLSTIIPPDIMLTEEMKLCINKYWETKGQFEAEERKNFKCPAECEQKTQCCIAYKVYDRMKAIKTKEVKECQSSSGPTAIKKFLPEAEKKIKGQCASVIKDVANDCKPGSKSAAGGVEPSADGGSSADAAPDASGDGGAEADAGAAQSSTSSTKPTAKSAGHRIGSLSECLLGLISGLAFISICYAFYII